MSDRITVTGTIPESEHNCWVATSTPVTEIRVVNHVEDLGKLILYVGDATIALTPQMWDIVLNCLVDAVGPTRRVTITEKLDAAAKVDDNGEAFGKTLNDFIGALGGAK